MKCIAAVEKSLHKPINCGRNDEINQLFIILAFVVVTIGDHTGTE